MLHMIAQPPTKQIKNIMEDKQAYIKMKKFMGYGTFKWGKQLVKLRHILQQHHNKTLVEIPDAKIIHRIQRMEQDKQTQDSAATITTIVQTAAGEYHNTKISFACPEGHTRQALDPPFNILKGSRVAVAWCNTCKKSWGLKKWICPCGIPWVDCTVHISAPKPVATQKREPKNKT